MPMVNCLVNDMLLQSEHVTVTHAPLQISNVEYWPAVDPHLHDAQVNWNQVQAAGPAYQKLCSPNLVLHLGLT